MQKNKYFIGLIVILAAGLVIFTGYVSPVFADSTIPVSTQNPTSTQVAQTGVHPILKLELKLERDELTLQTNNLSKMDVIAGKAQTRIDRLAAKGLDTTNLTTALEEFNAQLPAINAEHLKAMQILNTHAGFDANANVINAANAKQTLLDARAALKDTRTQMIAALKNLRQAMKDFRTANAPITTPTVVPQS